MTHRIGALLADDVGRHWLVCYVFHCAGRAPRYVCYRNGVRRTFDWEELS